MWRNYVDRRAQLRLTALFSTQPQTYSAPQWKQSRPQRYGGEGGKRWVAGGGGGGMAVCLFTRNFTRRAQRCTELGTWRRPRFCANFGSIFSDGGSLPALVCRESAHRGQSDRTKLARYVYSRGKGERGWANGEMVGSAESRPNSICFLEVFLSSTYYSFTHQFPY